jgi:hypothetical protein
MGLELISRELLTGLFPVLPGLTHPKYLLECNFGRCAWMKTLTHASTWELDTISFRDSKADMGDTHTLSVRSWCRLKLFR